jgi:hypothetical protein
VLEDVVLLAWADALADRFAEPSDLPGSNAEARAASAAVMAAAPAISHPRARRILPSARSRAIAARAASGRSVGSLADRAMG